jgi:hypothetical protein
MIPPSPTLACFRAVRPALAFTPKIHPMPVLLISENRGARHTRELVSLEIDDGHFMRGSRAVVHMWTRVHDTITIDAWRPRFGCAGTVR